MAKKFGKFLLFTAAVGTAAAAAYYYIQKKDSGLSDIADDDDDYDDFSDDLEDDGDTARNYVPLSFDSSSDTAKDTEDNAVPAADSETVSEAFSFEAEPEEEAAENPETEDDFTPLSSQIAQTENSENRVETSVEEFFDEEDPDDEEPPIIDSDDE